MPLGIVHVTTKFNDTAHINEVQFEFMYMRNLLSLRIGIKHEILKANCALQTERLHTN